MLLYKYRTCEQRTWEIFLNKKLYLSTPEGMNDPLDSSIDIEKEYDRAKNYINSIDDHPEKRKSFLIFLLNSSHKFQDPITKSKISLNQAVLRFVQQLGILSLSKTARDPLLWSHYANGHRGVCLAFDSEEMELENIFINSDVTYLEKPPYQDIFMRLTEQLGEFVRPWDKHHHSDEEGDAFYTKQLGELMRGNLLVKSQKWHYEEEYRLVSSKPGLHKFNPTALKQVIFGTKTSDSDIETILNMINHPDYRHVETYRVEHVQGTFEFDLKKLGDR